MSEFKVVAVPLEKRPRATRGIDYGVEGAILFRCPSLGLTYIWEAGHGVWGGRGCPQTYHPSGVFRYSKDDPHFGTRITSGRFGREAKAAVSQDIKVHTGIWVEYWVISKKSTLVANLASCKECTEKFSEPGCDECPDSTT